MFQFQSQIIENGKSRFARHENSSNSFYRAAKDAVSIFRIKDGAHVQIALMTFDHPSQSFKVMAYEFDVVDGKVENPTAVK